MASETDGAILNKKSSLLLFVPYILVLYVDGGEYQPAISDDELFAPNYWLKLW